MILFACQNTETSFEYCCPVSRSPTADGHNIIYNMRLSTNDITNVTERLDELVFGINSQNVYQAQDFTFELFFGNARPNSQFVIKSVLNAIHVCGVRVQFPAKRRINVTSALISNVLWYVLTDGSIASSQLRNVRNMEKEQNLGPHGFKLRRTCGEKYS